MLVRYQISGVTAAAISTDVENGIRTGALPAGEPLPPVRWLAAELGVSPATVAKAYQELKARGLLETAGRHGTRVRHRPAVSAPRSALSPPIPPGVTDLSHGGPDVRLLPPLGPHLRAIAADHRRAVGYPDGGTGTLPGLATAARARLAADGLDAPAITVTGGALDGIDRLLAACLRPGDAVAVEDPGWAALLDLVAASGLRAVPVAVDDDGPDPVSLDAALRSGARAAIITTRAQNPTGAAVTGPRADALRATLADHPGVLLIEDDHAAELAGVPLHPLAGATPRWAFLRSASKPFGPDLRIAVLAGDETTVARVAGRARIGSGWVSTMLQRLLLRVWEHTDTAAARAGYDRRRDTLRDAITAHGVGARGTTGLNVWVPVGDETAAVSALREQGWAVAPGALHRIATGPAIRVTVSDLDLPAVPALATAVAAAARPGRSTGYAY